MHEHSQPIRPKQKIVHIQRTSNHSLHHAPPRKLSRNYLPLIFLIIFIALSSWGISRYFSYRAKKISAQNYTQGLADLTAGNFSEAAKNLEKSIRSGNVASDALLKLGVSKYNQKDYTGAIEAYRQVLERDPSHTTASNSLGNVYRDQKDFEKAKEQYQKTISIDPAFAPAYANLSIMLLDLGQKKEALEIVRQGLEKIPESMELKNIQTLLEPEE